MPNSTSSVSPKTSTRDGPYLKASLIIFHEDAIQAIEAGKRKEISLGYKCQLEPTPGT